jgi:alpha-mannosidase
MRIMTDWLAVRGRVAALVRDVLRPAVYPARQPLAVFAHHLRGEPIPAAEAMARPFEPFDVGQRWGGRWDTTWFRFVAAVPDEWRQLEVAALVHLGGDEVVGFTAEGLVWVDGQPVQGLHHHHREYVLTTDAVPGQRFEFYVEAAANPIPPWHLADWPPFGPDYDGPPLYRLTQAEMATVDRAAEARYLDARLLIHLADRDEEVQRALSQVDDVDQLTVAATEYLARPSTSEHTVTAVGHAHIDSAWLWPIRETKRKCARTFANQLRLMERYSEHRFACSQAIQYQWIKDEYPSLWQQIKARVAEGRWEPVGGMWVEADCNLPSGESLVRQFVYGKRFFADEFGVETHECWIPDVFGYSAALPQIAVHAGVTALITQKMSWNDTNRFPHSTFWWEGHDGSTLLAHFPPANTYNGEFSAPELTNSMSNYADHGRLDRSLYPFGFGDGGGGPTRRMLESGARLQDLRGLPRVEIGTVGEFFVHAMEEARDLATWVGELYLEAHRGTYTTHADVKLANRRAEEALRAAELWSVAARLDRRAELEGAWKLHLLQQFHDIIPGSGIQWVYQDAARDYAAVRATADDVIAEAQAALVEGEGVTVFNAASHIRTEVLDVGDRLVVVTVPACGWAPLDPDAPAPEIPPVQVNGRSMSNAWLTVEWDEDGLLTSVWDRKLQREVLSGRGNVFQLHEDHPKAFDAWDVDRDYLDSVVELTACDSIEVVEKHPLRAAVCFRRRFGDSSVTQTMRLSATSRRLEFLTEVDWHERHRFLKVAFPVAVRSPQATYEIQHGHIQRPTVSNTSWDAARFEVCAHRWADLSEPGYGVALLNDCKYGYDIRGNVMRLSLLRGPGYPDPEADRGRHRFTYALLPHPGDLRAPGGVVAEAEALNLPLSIVAGQGRGCLLSVDRPGVSIEAVKRADRSDHVVVRICEVWGSRGPARLTLDLPLAAAWRSDLLERDLAEVPLDGRTVTLDLRPFELVTVKFALAG